MIRVSYKHMLKVGFELTFLLRYACVKHVVIYLNTDVYHKLKEDVCDPRFIFNLLNLFCLYMLMVIFDRKIYHNSNFLYDY